jgi:integrase
MSSHPAVYPAQTPSPDSRTALLQENVIKSVRLFEKDGKIHLDYRVHPAYRTDGKERYRFSTAEPATRRNRQRLEREKYTRALEHYLAHHRPPESTPLRVDDIALEALELDRGNRQPDVHQDYLTIYERSIRPVLGQRYLEEVRVADIRRWKEELLQSQELSRSRYIKYHRTLNFIFRYALENELIDRNPVALVDRRSKRFAPTRRTADSRGYYSAEEARRMLEGATGWFRVLLMCYLHTGMRTGEGMALKWTDLDLDQRTVTLQRSVRNGVLRESTKTGKARTVLLPAPLHEALEDYRGWCPSDLWLFPSPRTGEPYRESQALVKSHFKPLLKRLGIPYRGLYALRHTFASLAAQRGVPMVAIQKQLGHQELSTTLKFYIQYDLLGENKDRDLFDALYV